MRDDCHNNGNGAEIGCWHYQSLEIKLHIVVVVDRRKNICNGFFVCVLWWTRILRPRVVSDSNESMLLIMWRKTVKRPPNSPSWVCCVEPNLWWLRQAHHGVVVARQT